MTRNIFIALSLIISFSLSGQSIKRSYKLLEKSDYAKAKESFSKLLTANKDNVASNFGMAMILADDKSPYFNIIDAWQYIEAIEGKENQLTQEEMEIMGEYFLNTEVRKTSRPVKKKIEIAVEAVESRLIKYIREENNLEACYEVLERYPNFRHYDNVVHIRNQFEFRKYEKLNTFAGYNEFIEKFPEAAQIAKAKRSRNRMAFEEVKTKNTVEAFNQYLFTYPESEYTQQAIKLRNAAAYNVAEQQHTLEAYENFIAQYPDALDIPSAKKHQRDLMYEKAKRIKSLQAYNEFISMYPEGGYYMDVFNLKAGDLGMQVFRELGFDSPDFLWSKALDNNEFKEEARAICASQKGGYIVAGLTRETDSSYSDAWIIKLDAAGQMVWNKTIGQPYEDDVLEILESSTGDIIVVGYTQITADSGAKPMGWMFKLASDGSRIWNRNLGEMTISACAISSDDKVVVATYTPDTIPDYYFIQAYNEEGKKVAERDFVNYGHFNKILFTADNNAFLAGTGWFTYTDPKYYIQWEDTLKVNAKIVNADILGTNILLHAVDSTNNYLTTYNTGGSIAGQMPVSLRDSTDKVFDVLLSAGNDKILLGEDLLNSYLVKYDSGGAKTGEKLINGKIRFKRMVRNQKGEITYLLEGDDLYVISFSSVGF